MVAGPRVINVPRALARLPPSSLMSSATPTTIDTPALEAGTIESVATTVKLDIEHVFVMDDPRLWSDARKYMTLILIACAGLCATMGVNIYNPAIPDIKRQLHASDQDITLSLSLFIVVQGTTPLLWSAISEIKGRKYVYLISIALFIAGCAGAATAKTVAVLISMRVLQALGGSCVLAIGAGTLADVWDPKERGTKLGIYYSIPLLGPALGPIVGGFLTDAFNWRATFYFLVILGSVMWFAFLLLFKDTFRRERSATYQTAVRRAHTAASKKRLEQHEMKVAAMQNDPNAPKEEVPNSGSVTPMISADDIKLTITDVNPLPPLVQVLKRKNNISVLVPSSLMFGLAYSLSYTAVRTLSAAPYNYGALQVGLVLLSFGIGNIAGSVAGGRYSDYLLAKRKAAGLPSNAETRLDSTKIAMLWLPPAVICYAWFAEKHLHIAAISATLFVAGFTSIWVYSSTLAYIVDANVGRSSIAVATNSFFRGVGAFVSAEIAVPLQDGIGDAGLYMIWAGLVIVMELLLLLLAKKGTMWREKAERDEQSAS
ncbi:vacuolar DHA amino acid exporter [Auriculariales sp. MPI-PUGE-AT-0066]|nr:vacuolar DHA amino acid exporter [Auriculariales sp. MPI-PUGE-AT-0066]